MFVFGHRTHQCAGDRETLSVGLFNAASRRGSGSNRVYFLIDEIQQIVSDGMKLIFEQFRGIGGSIVAAHQTAVQLRREGTDLAATIDSCTAAKQVFRASDLESVRALEEIAGSQLTNVENWNQTYELGTGTLIDRFHPMHARQGQVNVRQMSLPILDRRRIMETGAEGLSSLVRFTFNSGYTCFGGATVPIKSIYPISQKTYDDREALPWPQSAGAVLVPRDLLLKKPEKKPDSESSVIDETQKQLDEACAGGWESSHTTLDQGALTMFIRQQSYWSAFSWIGTAIFRSCILAVINQAFYWRPFACQKDFRGEARSSSRSGRWSWSKLARERGEQGQFETGAGRPAGSQAELRVCCRAGPTMGDRDIAAEKENGHRETRRFR